MQDGIVKSAWKTLLRFPLAFLVVLIAAYEILILPQENGSGDFRLLLVCSLGLPLTIAAHLFIENVPEGLRRLTAALLGGAVFLALGLYYVALPLDPDVAAGFFLHRHAVLAIGLHLVVSFAAFSAGGRWAGFWSFNKTLFLRFLAAILFSGTLFLGLSLIIGGLGGLFGTGDSFFLHVRWYLSVLLFLVFNTWFFLAGVPQIKEIPEPAPYPSGLRNFCQYVLSPLVLVFAFVLLLLVLKVLLQGQVLEERLSFTPLAVVGILTYLLISPLDRTARWASLYSKIFFAILLPFVGLQIFGLLHQTQPKGLDETAYYLFVLSVWVGMTSLYFLFVRRATIVWMPVSLAAIAFLSIFGPWSAYSVSQRSQLNRLRELGGDILPLDWKNASKAINDLPAERSAEFYSQASDLSKFYGLRVLNPIFKEVPPAGASWNEIAQGDIATGPSPETQEASLLRLSFYTESGDDHVNVKGFDHYYREVQILGPAQGPQDCSFEFCAKLLEGENRIVLFDRKGEKARVDVDSFVKKLVQSKKPEIDKTTPEERGEGNQVTLSVKPEDLVFNFNANGVKGRLLLWTAYIEQKNKNLRLKSFQTKVLLADP